MDNLKKLLFYYSIILATVLFIGSIFVLREPQNLIISLSILPISVYLWVNTTSPGEVSVSKWSARLLLVVGIFSALGIYAFSLTKIKSSANQESELPALDEWKSALETLSNSDSDTDAVLLALESIRDELTDIKDDQENIREIIGISQSGKNVTTDDTVDNEDLRIPPTTGYITAKSFSETVNVFTSADNNANIIGTLTYGSEYPFSESKGSWYKILLPDDSTGWVKAVSVNEVTL